MEQRHQLAVLVLQCGGCTYGAPRTPWHNLQARGLWSEPPSHPSQVSPPPTKRDPPVRRSYKQDTSPRLDAQEWSGLELPSTEYYLALSSPASENQHEHRMGRPCHENLTQQHQRKLTKSCHLITALFCRISTHSSKFSQSNYV